MKRWVKQVGLVMMIFYVVAMLGACAKSSDQSVETMKPGKDSASPTKQVELNIATQETGDVLENLKSIISELEAQQPGLKIKLSNYDATVYRKEKLPAMMAANTPPDMMVMFGGTDLENYVKTGNLLDLTSFLKESGLDQKFLNLEDASVNGKVYRLPLAMFAEGLFYNKNILQQLNAQIPTTFKEFLALLDKAKQAGIVPIGMTAKDGWDTTMMINTIWARQVGPDASQRLASGELKWTSDEMKASFAIYEDLVKKGYFTKGAAGYSYSDLSAQFLQGKSLFIYDGSWQATTLDGPDSPLAGKVGFMAFPKIEGNNIEQSSINSANNAGYALSAKLSDDQKQVAYELLKKLFSETSMKNLMKTAGQPPAIKMDVSQVDGLVPAFKDVVNAINSSSVRFAALDVYLSTDVQTTLAENMQKLISGVITKDEALKAIQATQDKAGSIKK